MMIAKHATMLAGILALSIGAVSAASKAQVDAFKLASDGSSKTSIGWYYKKLTVYSRETDGVEGTIYEARKYIRSDYDISDTDVTYIVFSQILCKIHGAPSHLAGRKIGMDKEQLQLTEAELSSMVTEFKPASHFKFERGSVALELNKYKINKAFAKELGFKGYGGGSRYPVKGNSARVNRFTIRPARKQSTDSGLQTGALQNAPSTNSKQTATMNHGWRYQAKKLSEDERLLNLTPIGANLMPQFSKYMCGSPMDALENEIKASSTCTDSNQTATKNHGWRWQPKKQPVDFAYRMSGMERWEC